jgi:hypothetical protein
MLATRALLLIATLWVGSLWTIGYLVAPTLFATLTDSVLAGTIAGRLFRVEAWLSVFCAIGLVVLTRFVSLGDGPNRGRAVTWVALGMLACTMIGYFGLQPFMAALRETVGTGGVMDPESKIRFGILHGISSAIYLVQSLLGVALILKLR